MSSRSYLLRLFLPFTALILVLVGLSTVVVYWSGQATAQRNQQDDLERFARLLRPQVTVGQDAVVNADLKTQLDAAARGLALRLTLIAADGTVVYDSHNDLAALDNHATRPEIVEARQSGQGRSARPSPRNGQRSVYYAEPLDPARRDGVILRLSYPERSVFAVEAPTAFVVVCSALVAALLMSLLALQLHRKWVGPVRRVADVAVRLAEGDWSARVQPDGAIELHQLADRLNAVAHAAQKQLNDLRHQRGDLQALVDSLPDPILLTDPAERIRVINLPAANLLRVTAREALGRKLVAAVSDAVILDLFEEVQTAMKASDDAARTAESQGKPADREVVAHSREVRLVRNGRRSTYQALATRTQQGGVLIVLRDISTLAGAVQMKTDFVANASHELRTPIAAIKVAFETLAECIDDDPVQANRCMTIIAGHLRRFEEMLRDLLDLSRVESPDLRPMLSPLPANDVILALQSLWQHAADEKGVELRFKLDDPDLVFQSDKRLLDLILRNLIENALKFTPAGGHVTVEIARHALPPDAARAHEQLTGEGFSEVIVTVTDSGIGIPAEHLDRVFERFYQVDAARTGTNAGRGTGLGLAIVKHAALALGGSIKLASTMGKGTTATCVLPQIGEPAEPMPQLAAHE